MISCSPSQRRCLPNSPPVCLAQFWEVQSVQNWSLPIWLGFNKAFEKNQSSHSSRITHPVGLRPSTDVNPEGTFWGNHDGSMACPPPSPNPSLEPGWSRGLPTTWWLKSKQPNSHVGQQPGGLHPNLRLWRVALALVTASTKLWPRKRPANVSFRMEKNKKTSCKIIQKSNTNCKRTGQGLINSSGTGYNQDLPSLSRFPFLQTGSFSDFTG